MALKGPRYKEVPKDQMYPKGPTGPRYPKYTQKTKVSKGYLKVQGIQKLP